MAASSVKSAVCRTYATEQILKKLGIYTIGELANTDVEVLRHHLKKPGESIWNFANGRDSSLVESEVQENKGSMSNSTTVASDVTEESTAKMVLLSLAKPYPPSLERTA